MYNSTPQTTSFNNGNYNNYNNAETGVRMIATIQHGLKIARGLRAAILPIPKVPLVVDALTGNTIYEKKCWYRPSDCVISKLMTAVVVAESGANMERNIDD